MLNSIYLIIAILLSCAMLTGMTVTSFLKINHSFRDYIKDLLKANDEKLKQWFKDYFQDFYYPIDDRIKNLNYRLKEVEKRLK